MKISFGTKVERLWEIDKGTNKAPYHESGAEKFLYDEEKKDLDTLQDQFVKNDRKNEKLSIGLLSKGRDLFLNMVLRFNKDGKTALVDHYIEMVPPKYQQEENDSLIKKGNDLYYELRLQALKKIREYKEQDVIDNQNDS